MSSEISKRKREADLKAEDTQGMFGSLLKLLGMQSLTLLIIPIQPNS
jgi:hypothetical protein